MLHDCIFKIKASDPELFYVENAQRTASHYVMRVARRTLNEADLRKELEQIHSCCSRRQLPSCARHGRARAPVPTRAGYSNAESALAVAGRTPAEIDSAIEWARDHVR